MRQYNIVSRILIVLTAITFALASPVLVQEERHAYSDKSHVPKDVTHGLGKRVLEEDLDVMGWWHYLNGLHDPPPPSQGLLLNPASSAHVPEAHVPPQVPEDSSLGPMKLGDDARPETPLPASVESPTELAGGLGSNSGRWSTISNAPGEEPQSMNLEAAEPPLAEPDGKARLRRSYGTARGVDTVDAAQVELRNVVDPGP